MTTPFGFRPAALLAAGVFVLTAEAVRGQPTSPNEGLRVFKAANCVGCHKWSGVGGGGYGGAAANLRQTQLSIEEIELTIRCGRPTTGMPHFDADAYTDGSCYGLKKTDLTEATKPPEPDHPLRPADIKAVAAYVVTFVKDKGEPNFDQCQAFFGQGSRVCDIYAGRGAGDGQVVSASPASHGHAKVETATDANGSGNGK